MKWFVFSYKWSKASRREKGAQFGDIKVQLKPVKFCVSIRHRRGSGVLAQLTECLLSLHEFLDSIPRTI